LADLDGVIVIPQELAEEVITKSEERSEKENRMREDLKKGESFATAQHRYNVG
jgi:regulator of RNase E activity RraA